MVLGLAVLTHLGVARMTPNFGLFGTYGNAYLDQYVEDIDPPPAHLPPYPIPLTPPPYAPSDPTTLTVNAIFWKYVEMGAFEGSAGL